MAFCFHCKQDKPLADFPPSKATNKGQWCRTCHREKVCGPPTERACDGCGNVLVVTARRAAEEWVFCSRTCKDEARNAQSKHAREQGKPERMCVYCGVAMSRSMRADARFCSEACNSAAHALKRGNERLSRGSGRRRDIARAAVIARDRGRCHLCGKTCAPDDLTLDHLVPLSLGGTHDESNLAVACLSCNCSKGNRARGEQLMLVG
jgi:hypothetical protein